MRLDKALSLAGFSRTKSKKLIAEGRVSVCGTPLRDPGAEVALEGIALDGKELLLEEELYLMMNKPAGVLTATEDARLPTVVSLLPEALQRRKPGPVGRLDKDVTGLVLLTTDGVLAHRLISPRFKAEKLYRAVCEGVPDEKDIAAFAGGIELKDFTAKPALLRVLSSDEETAVAEAVLSEGKYHQVKRMFAAIGHPLRSLERRRIGCVTLDETLAPGEYRRLTSDEIHGLKQLVGLEETI